MGPRPDFFITGVIDASLKPAGKRLDTQGAAEELGDERAMMSEMRLMTYVGIGSAAEHLSDTRRMASTTSSADTDVNVRSETPERTLHRETRRWSSVSGRADRFWPPSQKKTSRTHQHEWMGPLKYGHEPGGRPPIAIASEDRLGPHQHARTRTQCTSADAAAGRHGVGRTRRSWLR